MSELENQDIQDVAALVNSDGGSIQESEAVLALLRTKTGTPIVPYVNTATLAEPGVVKPDGLTTSVAPDGVISVIGGGTGSSSCGIPTSVCKNLSVRKNGNRVYLKWQDPGDTIVDGQTLATWAGTKIVRKIGDYPVDESDGDVIVDNTIKNQYLENAFEDTITAGSDVYYSAFPYTTNGCYCYNNKNKFRNAIIYEFTINPNDSNPATRVQYPAGCVNERFTPAKMNYGNGFSYGDWEHAFFMPRPVMLRTDGTVDYELNKNDFSYRADGVTRSDISNQNYDGNAMIEFPQVWLKFVMDGTLQHVYISNVQVDDSYHCYTHYNKNGVLLDNIYIMAYQPCNVSNKLRSLSGKGIMTRQSGTTEIAYAQANGGGWNLWDYGEWQMLQMLGTLISKSTDFQTVFGYGRGGGDNNTTGECDANGMFYGESPTASSKVKFFGIENAWGNYWKRMNGCVYNTTDGLKYKLCDYTADGTAVLGYNTTGEGYKTHQTFTGSSGGYISKMDINADGLFPTVASGSNTTYFADGLWWANNGFACVGGDYDAGALCGGFCLSLSNAVSYGSGAFGGSLSCKPL